MSGRLRDADPFAFPTVMQIPGKVRERLAAGAVAADKTGNPQEGYRYIYPNTDRLVAAAAASKQEAGEHCDNHAWSGASRDVALWMGYAVGWPAAAKLATEAYDTLVAHKLRSRIPVPVYMDEPGEDVDVSAFLGGEDACFLGRAEALLTGAGRSAVRIRHNVFSSAGVEVRYIVTRGILTAAIAHLLETSGVQVAIDIDMHWSYHCQAGGYANGTLVCPIKEFGQALDLPRLAYWLAHPSVLRRIVFAATGKEFHNHMNRPITDESDWLRVGEAQVVGEDVVSLARRTLQSAGIELL